MMLCVTSNETICAHFYFLRKSVHSSSDQVTWKGKAKVVQTIAYQSSIEGFKDLHHKSNDTEIEIVKRPLIDILTFCCIKQNWHTFYFN